MKNKKLILSAVFLLVGILLISFASAYARTNQYTSSGFFQGDFMKTLNYFDKDMCQAGQDFVLQIDPVGCEPSVVRSDLLEEQDVPVFCPIVATKINPLINVESIYRIRLAGEHSRDVSNIGFFPARAALGVNDNLNIPVILDNVGYAVIVLKRQPNESAMPEYVEGNISAKIKYNIKNAFGIGRANFYLKQLNDNEWEKEYQRYSFWNGKGYLRAEEVDNEGARISLYSGTTLLRGKQSYQEKITSVYLKEGEESQQIYIPSFDYCMGGLNLKLDSVEAPGVTVRLKINNDEFEVAKGDEFLEGKCRVLDLEKKGLNQEVHIHCSEDEQGLFGSSNDFYLRIVPEVNLSVNGTSKKYVMGERIYQGEKEEKSIYFAYAYTKRNTKDKDDIVVVVVASPSSKEKLSEDDISHWNDFVKQYRTDQEIKKGFDLLKESSKTIRSFGSMMITGDDIYYIPIKKEPEDVRISKIEENKKVNVKVLGLVSPYDDKFSENPNYTNAMNDFDILISDFPYIEEDQGISAPYGEKALGEKIKLARDTNQKQTMKELCGEFFRDYPNANSSVSDGIKISCNDVLELANSEISTRSVLVNNELKEIKLQGIYEPASEDYNATILIEPPKGNSFREVLTLNEVVSFGEEEVGDLKSGVVEAVSTKVQAKFDTGFLEKVNQVADELGVDRNYLLAIMHFETGGSFKPGEANKANSGATGLIQFMPKTYNGLTNNDADIKINSDGLKYIKQLSEMTQIEQMDLVEKYFKRNGGKNLKTLSDAYMVVLYPEAVGKSEDYILFKDTSMAYKQNEGLDENEDEKITKQEASSKVLDSYKYIVKELGERTSTETNSGEHIKLLSLDTDSAKINFVYESSERKETFDSRQLNLQLDKPSSYKGYTFTLKKVNLKKVAKVSIIPNINYADSNATFKFKIGIEKRGIQLAPDKIKEKIENLDKSIEQWEKISEGLGKTVKTLKATCLATGAGLTIKNLVNNAGGKGIARQKVMREAGGWYEKCADMVNSGKYSSSEECLIKESDKIDEDVQLVKGIIDKQQEEIKEIEKPLKDIKFLRQTIINTEKFTKDYVVKVNQALGEISAPCDEVDMKNMPGLILNETDIEKLKEIELYSMVLREDSNNEMAKERLCSILVDMQKNSESDIITNSIKQNLQKQNFDFEINSYGGEKSIMGVYTGKLVLGSKIEGNWEGKEKEVNYPIEIITYDNQPYVIILQGTGSDYIIKDAYKYKKTSNNKIILGENKKEKFQKIFSKFKKYDKSSYENEFKSSSSEPKYPIVSFYETEPYLGLPAIVPFDLKHGWYAASKATLPTGSNIKSYDSSGKVNSFWLCNVGKNGIEEFNLGTRDDICQMINIGTSQTYQQFYGLGTSETQSLFVYAVNAIETASEQRMNKPNIKSVKIKTPSGYENIKVGKPATNIPDIQCEDFMSPKECNILFNVCDPVICPPSRCDFGGTYPVRDVIQTGIIGSTLLCLPNWKEKIYIPICLSGVNAGVENWVSILRSYRDCLQTNLDTGETIGICDEMQSVYLCDFFWRQSFPLAKLVVPKIVSSIMGQSAHGGGEYLSVQNAWDTTSKAVNYFTQIYGVNSYKAFKARSTEELGTEVCRKYFSIGGPKLSNLFDALTEPDSPVQFNGRFSETLFTSLTNPPTSHYKVFYTIYAGKDRGAYYSVYLKGANEISFYQDTTFSKFVDSGYIPKGEYATETKDFTAPSGYQQLCIMVNGYEECGFKEVSTSIAVDYLQAEYLKEQSVKKDINTESACISGTASLYNLLDPNIQSGVEGAINPAIYQRGIIRICATENPGKGTDTSVEGQRWVEVGYCGDKNVKCWLDRDSVEDAINSPDILKYLTNGTITNVRDVALDQIEENYRDYLKGEDFNVKHFKKKIEEIEALEIGKKISPITKLLPNVYFNDEKAKLFFMRGNAFASLAKLEYGKKKVEEVSEEEGRHDLCKKEEGKEFECMNKKEGTECVKNLCLVGDDKSNEDIQCCKPKATEEEVKEEAVVEEEKETTEDEFVSPTFEFQDGTLHDNFYYKFDNQWYWSHNTKLWMTTSQLKITKVFLSFINNPTKKDKDFISKLENKTYYQGLKLLIKRTKDSNKGSLVAGNVEMDNKRIFNVETDSNKMSFKYDKYVWFCRFKVYDWHQDPNCKNNQEEYICCNLVENYKNDLYGGARFIFEQASKTS